MEEIWKDVVGYEGVYQVSNLGNVKSLERIVLKCGKNKFIQKETILKPCMSSNYLAVCFCKDKKRKTVRIHQIVAEAFLNHKPDGHKLVVDHINSIKTDNNVSNLQIVTNRFNLGKSTRFKTSQYPGVSYNSRLKKWVSSITFEYNQIHLGTFTNEYDAHLAYKNKLKEKIHGSK